MLADRWTPPGQDRPRLTVTAVLSGEIDGWPVTICDTLDHYISDVDRNRTVVCIVHLPLALPTTVALPTPSRRFREWGRARLWHGLNIEREPLSARDLYLASDDATFGTHLATPEVRSATIDGLIFWRLPRP